MKPLTKTWIPKKKKKFLWLKKKLALTSWNKLIKRICMLCSCKFSVFIHNCMNENEWKWMKMNENERKWMKMNVSSLLPFLSYTKGGWMIKMKTSLLDGWILTCWVFAACFDCSSSDLRSAMVWMSYINKSLWVLNALVSNIQLIYIRHNTAYESPLYCP